MHKAVINLAVFEEGELAIILEQKGLSKQQFADLIDFPMDIVEGLMSGKKGLTIENAKVVANSLKIPFNELFGKVFTI